MTDAAPALTFHQAVNTPNGRGIVQGRLVAQGKPDKILVSHSTKDNPNFTHVKGIWALEAYLPEEVTPIVDNKPEPIQEVLARVQDAISQTRS